MIRSFSPNKNANIYAETSIKDAVEFANKEVLSVLKRQFAIPFHGSLTFVLSLVWGFHGVFMYL